MQGFEAEDIDFAFPSKKIYMANDDKRQLKIQMLDALSGTVTGPETTG